MAITENVRSISLLAGATDELTNAQFTFVDIGSDGGIEFPAANGVAVGVLLNRPGQNAGTGAGGVDASQGFAGEVALLSSGRLKVKAAGAITIGNFISTDASGLAVGSADPAADTVVLGRALTATAAANELVEFIPLLLREHA